MHQSKMRHMLMVAIVLCGLLGTVTRSDSQPQGKLIPLVAGSPQQGTFSSQYLTIAYNYTFTQNQLTVSGNLNFDNSLTMNYPGLRQFYLEVLLLNGQGGVIERSNVTLRSGFTWGDDEAIAASSFNAQLSVPPQTASLTFYYNGVTQGGVGGGSGTSFWNDPVSGPN
jgi:hypothetical protein